MQKSDVAALDGLRRSDRLVDIFLDLVAFDTQADFRSADKPSSAGQLRLGAHILRRLGDMGFKGSQSEEGIITVRIPATEGYEKAERLCLLAHMDTAPDASGRDVRPALVTKYAGEGIELENGLRLTHEISPELERHAGENIIVTDGNTLLGGDDKAGVAVILRILELCADDRVIHGPLTAVFSVDEEIGRSFGYIDVASLDCDFAVTVDGCERGELDVATFNAIGAVLEFKGCSVHTGSAFGRLRNALKMACAFMSMLPESEAPESTKGEEGFYHVHDLKGNVERAELRMILRDFSDDGILRRKAFVESAAAELNEKYGEGSVRALFVEQYANMEKHLREKPEILQYCRMAFAEAGVKLSEQKVRGGTDGAGLSAKGLPCPNVFTGALNCHGVYECLPVESLHDSFKVCKALCEVVAAGGKD